MTVAKVGMLNSRIVNSRSVIPVVYIKFTID